MNPAQRIRVVKGLRYFTTIAGLISVGMGVLITVGWTWGLPSLVVLSPGITMKINASICFILLGLSLLLLYTEERAAARRRIGYLLAGVATGIASLTLSQYAFGWDLGIDQLLAKDFLASPTESPGRMSPITAIFLVFSGLALLLLEFRASQVLSSAVVILALVVSIGHLFNFESLYQHPDYGTVALHTSLMALVLSMGILVARPRPWMLKTIVSDLPGSRSLRNMLPLSILLMIFLAWLVEKGEGLGLFDSDDEGAILVVLLTLLHLPLFFFNALRIDKSEEKLLQRDRLYATLSHVSQTVVHAKSQQELFDSLCRVAVDVGGFRLAWVGILEPVTQAVNPVALNGIGTEMIQSLTINLDRQPYERGLLSQAFRHHEIAVSDDASTDPRLEYWHEKCRQYGYRAMAAIPFRFRGETIGTLTLSAEEVKFFQRQEELDLLHKIGNDISFALDTMGAEADRQRATDSLSQSEARYHQVLDSLMEGCQIIDTEWRYLYINEVAAEQGRYRPQELLNHTMMEMYPGIENTELFAAMRLCMEERIPHRMENQFHFPDGSVGWFELSIQPAPEGVFILSTDITKRKLGEEALRKSNEEYRTLFEDSPVSLWVEDLSEIKQRLDQLKANGITDIPDYLKSHPEFVRECSGLVKVLDVNSTATKLYHAREKSQLLGSLTDILPLPVEEFEQELIQIANGQLNFEREGIEETLTGEKIFVHIRWSVAPGYEDSLARVIVSTIDFTERRLSEEKLRRSDQILQRVQALVLAADAQGNVIYVSPGAKSILNYEPEELLGDNWWLVSRPDQEKMDQDRQYLIRVARGEVELSSEAYERPVQDKAGNIHWISWVDALGPGNTVIRVGHDITEHRQKEERIQLQLRRLAALRAIDTAISASSDLRIALDVLLQQTVQQLGVDAADLLIYNPSSMTLQYAAKRGYRSGFLPEQEFRLSETYASRAVSERREIHIKNLAESGKELVQARALAGEAFVDYFAVPLIAKGVIRGVLEVYHRSHLNVNSEWLEFLTTLAGQAAIAIESGQLFLGLQRSNAELKTAYDATIEGWSRAMDLRDKETEGHTQRVTELTLALARAMNLPDDELVQIRRGALLHDIGKLGVPDAILLKPGKLTEQEWEIMRQHPTYAYEMLASVAYLRPALEIPHYHHEKWDGTGYPMGLKGYQIPLAARMFAVVDVWDALTSDRPYRPASTREQTLAYIKEQSGKHFDPEIVELFLKFMGEG